MAGYRTPKPIFEMKQVMPEVHRELLKVRETLETHFREIQDVEFTGGEWEAVHASDSFCKNEHRGWDEDLC